MTITKYDYDLGRLVYPGATLPSPCPHGWTERCPHCMGGEINRLRAELPQSRQDEMENYRLALAWIEGQSTDPQAKEIAATALNGFADTRPLHHPKGE